MHLLPLMGRANLDKTSDLHLKLSRINQHSIEFCLPHNMCQAFLFDIPISTYTSIASNYVTDLTSLSYFSDDPVVQTKSCPRSTYKTPEADTQLVC